MVGKWLCGSDLADFAFAFLLTLFLDVLQKRLLVNPKR
jgi:hypothetical protein